MGKKIKQHHYFIKDGLNTSFELNVIWHSITFQDFHIIFLENVSGAFVCDTCQPLESLYDSLFLRHDSEP